MLLIEYGIRWEKLDWAINDTIIGGLNDESQDKQELDEAN